MDFLIYFEGVQREYENNCLVKAELERRGYRVKMVSTVFGDYWKSLFYRPKVNLVHAYYDDPVWVSKYRSLVNTKILNLQYEQAVTREKNGKLMHMPCEEGRKADHICWGRAAAEGNLEVGVPQENIHEIGPLQFDLMRPEFRGYFLSKEELAEKYGLDASKEWILYISNFSLLRKLMGDEHLTFIGLKPGHIDAVEYACDFTVEILRRFLEAHPEVEYIYRPHPDESNNEDYLALERDFTNFHILRDLSVKQWIVASDRINAWNSTCVAEGLFARKPFLILSPDPETMTEEMREFHVEILNLDKAVHTYEEFEEWNTRPLSDMDEVLENGKTRFEQEYPMDWEKFEEYYGDKWKDGPVYKRIADVCEAMLKDPAKQQEYRFPVDKKDVTTNLWWSFRWTIRYYTYPVLHKLIPRKFAPTPAAWQYHPKHLRELERKIRSFVK